MRVVKTKEEHAVKIGELIGDLNMALATAHKDGCTVSLNIVKFSGGARRINFEVK